MAIHYIVGIGTHPMVATNAGERYLDFMFTYTDEEVASAKLAQAMTENKMWKTDIKSALQSCNVDGLAQNFSAISLRARYAQLMVCHFTSEDDMKFTREDLELIVKYKPVKELKQAQIFI